MPRNGPFSFHFSFSAFFAYIDVLTPLSCICCSSCYHLIPFPCSCWSARPSSVLNGPLISLSLLQSFQHTVIVTLSNIFSPFLALNLVMDLWIPGILSQCAWFKGIDQGMSDYCNLQESLVTREGEIWNWRNTENTFLCTCAETYLGLIHLRVGLQWFLATGRWKKWMW